MDNRDYSKLQRDISEIETSIAFKEYLLNTDYWKSNDDDISDYEYIARSIGIDYLKISELLYEFDNQGWCR